MLFTTTAVVLISQLDGTAEARHRALAAVARQAFGDAPFSILQIERDLQRGTAMVTLTAGPPSGQPRPP